MLEYLPKVDVLIFFILSFIWIRFSFLHHNSLLKIIQEHKKESMGDYEEKMKILTILNFVSVLGTLVFAYVLSKEYKHYPNLVFGYTLFCLVAHLRLDLHESIAKTVFELFEKEEE